MKANTLKAVLKGITAADGEDATLVVSLVNGGQLTGGYRFTPTDASVGILELAPAGAHPHFIDIDSIVWVSTPIHP